MAKDKNVAQPISPGLWQQQGGPSSCSQQGQCPRGVPAPRHSPEWCLPALVPKAWLVPSHRKGGSAMAVHSTAKIPWSCMAGHTQVLGWPSSMECFLWARSRVLVPGPQCWESSPSQGWGHCRAPEQPTLLLQLRGASRSTSPWWSFPSPAIPAGRGCCKTACIVCPILSKSSSIPTSSRPGSASCTSQVRKSTSSEDLPAHRYEHS